MKPISLREHIGDNIRVLRKALGLTQGDLAEEMSERGFGWLRQTVDESEAGRRDATIAELIGLAEVFQVPLARLLGQLGPTFGMPIKSISLGDRVLKATEVSDLVARDPSKVDQGNFLERRRKAMEARTTAAGPIFLYEAEGKLGIKVTLPPWGQEFLVSLEPGVPYTARDDHEAEQLLAAIERGTKGLRVIDRHEAYRIRRRKRGTHQEG